MGSNLCSPESHQKSIVAPKRSETPVSHHQHTSHFENTDPTQTDEGPTPLSTFIKAHSTPYPICASNSLSFQTSSTTLRHALKIDSVKLVKPHSGDQHRRVSKRKQPKAMPRCSIDILNVGEFSDTVKNFVISEKNMESFNRIEINQSNFIHLRKEDIKKYYRFEAIVGEGAYGSVYKAQCLTSKQSRAIKVIKKEHLGREKKEQVFAELQLLKKMDHPNIIKLYEVFEWEKRYQVVTEFCNGGSIIDFIKSRTQFNEQTIRTILKQLLGCLNYLNTIKIVHRDIKLENVVFIKKIQDNSTDDDIEIKLLDFGTACRLSRPKMKCHDLVGTVSYMPPEIIKGYFTDRCDLWSCGVIFYILLTSKSPFKCKRKEDTLHKILTHQIDFQDVIWEQVSDNAKDLLQRLLEKDPYKRISAEEALKHRWFQEGREKGGLKHSAFLQNLSNYYRQNNLISVIQSYLVFSKINQEERKKINDIFKELDHNHDGFINQEELIQAYRQHVPEMLDLGDIQFILNKIDKDHSGSINLSQFTSAVVNKEKLWGKNALQEAFDYFDIDKTGFIERNELAKLIAGSDNQEIESLLAELDLDRDRRISKQQFISYFLNKGCLY